MSRQSMIEISNCSRGVFGTLSLEHAEIQTLARSRRPDLDFIEENDRSAYEGEPEILMEA